MPRRVIVSSSDSELSEVSENESELRNGSNCREGNKLLTEEKEYREPRRKYPELTKTVVLTSDRSSEENKENHRFVETKQLQVGVKTVHSETEELTPLEVAEQAVKHRKSRIRKPKVRRITPESSSFQLTKRCEPDNAFLRFAYNGKQLEKGDYGAKRSRVVPSRKRRRKRKSKGEVDESDELTEMSDTETTEYSLSESDEKQHEGSDDLNYYASDTENEVEALFTKCEAISKKLEAKVNMVLVAKEPSASPSSYGACLEKKLEHFVSQAEASTLFPDGLELKNYQLVGLNWLNLLYQEHLNGILADEMGLGKTIQAIALIALLKKRYSISGPHLLIAPGSTLENWRREVTKWLPDFEIVVYHGGMNEREALRRRLRSKDEFNIILTTYSYFERQSNVEDRSFFYQQNFQYVVFDEAHAIKNLSSQRYQRLMQLKSKRRLLLSGTPVQNNLNELLALMSFAMPQVFVASSKQLNDHFKNEKIKRREMLRLRKALKPLILRRVKRQVLSQLGLKKEELVSLELSATNQASLYKKCLEELKQRREKGSLTSSQVTNTFANLRKICNHPLLVQNYFGRVHEGVDRRLPKLVTMLSNVQAFGEAATKSMIEKEINQYSDWKLHVLCSEYASIPAFAEIVLPAATLWESSKCCYLRTLLPKLKQEGHRVVLFSQWTSILDIIEELLSQLGLTHLRFDGQTKIRERQGLVDEFTKSTDITVFLLSTRAGGLGINLTAADTVILHDLDFNPTVDQQAMDRVHRIGQTKPVTVYKLLNQGAVDEHIHSMQQRKMELDNALFEKDDPKSSTKKSEQQDIREIVKLLCFA